MEINIYVNVGGGVMRKENREKLKEIAKSDAGAAGYVEYAVKRVVVTTTIPYELAKKLKEDGLKLSRWIDMQIYHPTPRHIELDIAEIKRSADTLKAHFNQVCIEKYKLQERVVALEKAKA